MPLGRARRRSELGLLAVGALVVVFADVLASLGVTGALPAHATRLILFVVVLAVVVNVANRLLVPESSPVLLPVVLVLNGLGYVMISRLDPAEAGFQAAWTIVGVVGYLATLLVVRRSRDLERYRYLMLLTALVLLVLPFVPHIGEDYNGARLWVRLGPMSFQPVEIAKLLLVIFFASYFVEKRELLTMPTHRIGNHLLPDLRPFGPVALAGACSVLVILAEHDVGFSLLLFVLFLAMLWVATGRWAYLLVGALVFVAGTFLAAHLLSQVHERLSIWLDPWKDPSGAGYQPIQGELAFGQGGLVGTGLGLGTPGVIPLPTSDFIFAAIGEELGLLGTSAIVVAYLLLVGTGLRTALLARSEFAKLTAVGLTTVLGFQAFFIMAGVTRLLPLTGVTLPFVSYGGSSLVANYVLVALLARISHEGAAPGAPALPATLRRARLRTLHAASAQ